MNATVELIKTSLDDFKPKLDRGGKPSQSPTKNRNIKRQTQAVHSLGASRSPKGQFETTTALFVRDIIGLPSDIVMALNFKFYIFYSVKSVMSEKVQIKY